MLKRLSILTLLLILLLILAGCDNGSVSDSSVSKSSGLVKVSLAVSGNESGLQKAAVVDGSYWTSLTYQYNAVPQWQDPDGNNIHGTACGYIFRRAILGNLRFSADIYHEDEEFTPLLLLRAEEVYPTHAKAYYYNKREQSITSSKTPYDTEKPA